MPSPFPGMDPYLEQPTFWSSFHSRLIIAIADAIEPQLGSQYYVEVESRKEAIAFHLEGLREEGLPIPEPTTLCEYVEAS